MNHSNVSSRSVVLFFGCSRRFLFLYHIYFYYLGVVRKKAHTFPRADIAKIEGHSTHTVFLLTELIVMCSFSHQ